LNKKVKIKLNKEHNKITVDYSKATDQESVKFDMLVQINQTYELLFMINTELDMSRNNVKHYRGANLLVSSEYQDVRKYLDSVGIEYKLQRKNREVTRLILGIATGKKELVEDVLLAVALKKGDLTREFYDLLCCSHDIMLGIDPKKELSVLLGEYENCMFSSTDETKDFNYTLIDSQWMQFFFTNLERSLFER